jgi:GT2 family glycosyltransferase
VIVTYGRESVLTDTIESLLPQLADGELIVVDQTPVHEDATQALLGGWAKSGAIRWIRRDRPSITAAMNVGLVQAASSTVLFLDDDIVPCDDLVREHLGTLERHPDAWAVVGRVFQPGEHEAHAEGHGRTSLPARSSRSTGLLADLDFPFWSDDAAWVSNVMAGNLSVRRDRAIAVGGFDENFVGSAYRFETEFARRIIKAGGKIRFAPSAWIDHLRAERGGTRSRGSHLTSASPIHGIGDYYFALRSGITPSSVAYILRRPFREVCTKFHLRHPWYIPVKLLGEFRALGAGIRAWLRPPKFVSPRVIANPRDAALTETAS